MYLLVGVIIRILWAWQGWESWCDYKTKRKIANEKMLRQVTGVGGGL